MAQDIRRMCKCLSSGDERNQVHRRQGSAVFLMSEERDASVNRESVNALISRELATWVPSERFPGVQQLQLTAKGLEYIAHKSRGYLRCMKYTDGHVNRL